MYSSTRIRITAIIKWNMIIVLQLISKHVQLCKIHQKHQDYLDDTCTNLLEYKKCRKRSLYEKRILRFFQTRTLKSIHKIDLAISRDRSMYPWKRHRIVMDPRSIQSIRNKWFWKQYINELLIVLWNQNDLHRIRPSIKIIII